MKTFKYNLTNNPNLPNEVDESQPCFYCGEDNAFSFYIATVKKVVCFNCVGKKEVDESLKNLERRANRKNGGK